MEPHGRAHFFYQRGIIETWGRGTLKIARLMREQGLEPPLMSVREGAVVVTFALPVEGDKKARGAPQKTPEKTPEKTLEKTDAAILRLLKAQPELTMVELADQLHKSPSVIERAVRKLRESGRLQRIGPDKGGYWKVLR